MVRRIASSRTDEAVSRRRLRVTSEMLLDGLRCPSSRTSSRCAVICVSPTDPGLPSRSAPWRFRGYWRGVLQRRRRRASGAKPNWAALVAKVSPEFPPSRFGDSQRPGIKKKSGGGGGNRTRVRMVSRERVYMRRFRSISAWPVTAPGETTPRQT